MEDNNLNTDTNLVPNQPIADQDPTNTNETSTVNTAPLDNPTPPQTTAPIEPATSNSTSFNQVQNIETPTIEEPSFTPSTAPTIQPSPSFNMENTANEPIIEQTDDNIEIGLNGFEDNTPTTDDLPSHEKPQPYASGTAPASTGSEAIENAPLAQTIEPVAVPVVATTTAPKKSNKLLIILACILALACIALSVLLFLQK